MARANEQKITQHLGMITNRRKFSPDRAFDMRDMESDVKTTFTRYGYVKENTVALPGGILGLFDYRRKAGLRALMVAGDDGTIITLPHIAPHADDGIIAGAGFPVPGYNAARDTSDVFDVASSALLMGQENNGIYYATSRLFLIFDTSGIPDDATITSVKLKLAISQDRSDADFDIQIHKYNWDNPITDANREANYDGALAATTGAVTLRNTLGIATDTYYTSPALDTTWVSKTGYTKYAILNAKDVDAIAPVNNNIEYVRIYTSEDTTYPPILDVNYTE